MPRIRVIFSRKISEKGMSIFHKNSRKGYNICKEFQIGSVILMAQMTNQKKTELIDYFHLLGLKIHTFRKNFWKWKPFSQNSPQNRILETSIRHKNSEKSPTFSSKIPERVDIETIKWHTPVRQYHESPPGSFNSYVCVLYDVRNAMDGSWKCCIF